MKEKMSNTEKLELSLSPFTIPELFDTNLHVSISPYLTTERKKYVPKKHKFYETGQIADRLYYLNKGVVIETLINENGLEKSFLIFPPYLVGFNYCAHEQPIFPCTSAHTECEVFSFAYDELLSLMQRDQKLMRAIIKVLALDFRMANGIALQNQSCSSHEKICQTILSYHIASKYTPNLGSLRLTQQLIAGLTGVHRISVVNTIGKLRDEQIITYSDKTLVVSDPQRLQQIAYGKYSIR